MKRKHKKLIDILLNSKNYQRFFIRGQKKLTEEAMIKYYEDSIDRDLNDLAKNLGRKLTEQEYDGLLDIVSEYSPKDKEGYIFDYLPFDYALKLYRMKRDEELEKFLVKLKVEE